MAASTPPPRRLVALESGLRYEPHIDGLRGVAIAAVVAFHVFPGLFPGGYIGVDVFFVISGFLISSILYRELGAPAASSVAVLCGFYARRVRRIFPALVVVLLAALGLGFALLVPAEYERLADQAQAGAAFYQNLLLARQVGYFEPAAFSNPLLHLWSLAVEEQFYLLWPLAVWLAIRLRLRPLPLAVFFAATSLGWALRRPPEFGPAAFFLPQMRLWEILIGAIAVAVPRAEPATRHRPSRSLAATAGLLAMAGGAVMAARAQAVPGPWTVLPTLGTGLLLWAGPGVGPSRWIFAHPALVWLGLISYPLYLWHWPLLSFAQIASGAPLSAAAAGSALACSVALAAATFSWIERPVRRWAPTASLAWSLVAALAGVAALAAIVRRNNGFPARFPPLVSAIGAYRYDGAAATRVGTYFLMAGQDETAFPVDPTEIRSGRPTLYLWGDSHAASLYPGLRQAYGSRMNIVQRTAAATPPFLPDRFNPGNARQTNQFIFNSIVRDRPQVVLLHANWPLYEWPRVAETIQALKRVGVPRVVVLGPVPRWSPSLPQAIFNYARRHPGADVPRFMPMPEGNGFAQLDEAMANLCRASGAEYLSAAHALAGPGGYRVRTGDSPDTLLSYDNGHLTVRAAVYLVAQLPSLQP